MGQLWSYAPEDKGLLWWNNGWMKRTSCHAILGVYASSIWCTTPDHSPYLKNWNRIRNKVIDLLEARQYSYEQWYTSLTEFTDSWIRALLYSCPGKSVSEKSVGCTSAIGLSQLVTWKSGRYAPTVNEYPNDLMWMVMHVLWTDIKLTNRSKDRVLQYMRSDYQRRQPSHDGSNNE